MQEIHPTADVGHKFSMETDQQDIYKWRGVHACNLDAVFSYKGIESLSVIANDKNLSSAVNKMKCFSINLRLRHMITISFRKMSLSVCLKSNSCL